MALRETWEKLAKWRGVFASWQCGTRSDKDAECNAIRDHREVTILLRAEVTALTALLLEKNVFTHEELQKQVEIEAEHLDMSFRERFPGFSTSLVGVEMQLPLAAETMKKMNWRP